MRKYIAGLCTIAAMLAAPAAASADPYIWGQPHSPTGSTGVRHATPTDVPGIADPVEQILGTNTTNYALTTTGKVYAEGAAKNGELGDGQPASAEPQFTTSWSQVQFPAGVTIASLTSTAGDADGLAISTDHTLYGWGYNHAGELCTSKMNVDTPIAVATNVDLAAGAGDHTIYTSGGTLYGCGTNLDGDLGGVNTRSKGKAAAAAIAGVPGTIVVALRASYHNSGALTASGDYYDWGLGTGGQLGNGTTTDSSTPVHVSLPAPVAQVSLGGSLADNGQTIAILTDGSVWTWGTGQFGQLGDGSTAGSSTPVQVTVPAGVTFSQVESGGSAEYAIDSTGAVWAWGQNNDGQLGIGKADTQTHPLPTAIGISLSEVVSTAFNVIGLQ